MTVRLNPADSFDQELIEELETSGKSLAKEIKRLAYHGLILQRAVAAGLMGEVKTPKIKASKADKTPKAPHAPKEKPVKESPAPPLVEAPAEIEVPVEESIIPAPAATVAPEVEPVIQASSPEPIQPVSPPVAPLVTVQPDPAGPANKGVSFTGGLTSNEVY